MRGVSCPLVPHSTRITPKAWHAASPCRVAGRPRVQRPTCIAAEVTRQNSTDDKVLIPARHEPQLRAYLELMLEMNKVMNLTAVRDPLDAWDRHVVDSASLLPILLRFLNPKAAATPAGLSVIDVGSGSGFPGMVFAILQPDWKVTLLDSTRKKCDFLRSAASTLGAKNVDVIWARAEEAGQQPGTREAYDVAVARAVAEARVLAELCLPLVRPGGLWLAAKGVQPQAEVNAASHAINACGGRLLALEDVHASRVVALASSMGGGAEGEGEPGGLTAPPASSPRTALVVAKVRPTPPHLPRRPGVPNRQPL